MISKSRVLISAYACEPGEGSEPGIGWNWARQAARFHEVWVITRSNNRQLIEKALAQESLPDVHFVYFDLPKWSRFWKKGQRGVRLYYYLWQIGAYFAASKLHERVGFDVIHHATLGTYWMPCFLTLLPAPTIWGPVGGGESTPMSFRFKMGLQAEIREILRDLVRLWGRLDPFVRMTARRAEVGLATSRDTEKALLAAGCRRTAVLSQVGLPIEEFRRLSRIPCRQEAPFRVASLGRLLHWKGFSLGVRAFAEFHRKNPQSEYWLLGEGPEQKRLKKLAQELGVGDHVIFVGQSSRERVLERLAECDVLLHPSLHDSGGWVCLEALALGRPVVCLDLGGPALMVSEDCGVKIPALSPDQVVRDLESALHRLAGEPELRARMGRQGRRRVEGEFTWNSKGDIWSELVCNRVAVSAD